MEETIKDLPVAYFDVTILSGSSEEDSTKPPVARLPIRGNRHFYIGRSSKHCVYSWPEPTLSNKHLRVHCIVYEESADSGIPPLVYAQDLSTNGTYLKRWQVHGSRGVSSYTTRMDRKTGSVLLNPGDQLLIGRCISLTYVCDNQLRDPVECITKVEELERQRFADRYAIFPRKLGIGGHGTVYLALHRGTNRQLVCKVVDLPDREQSGTSERDTQKWKSKGYPPFRRRWHGLKRMFREFEVLESLSHPNIITVEKVFWSTSRIYIFQELVTGGDLFSYIEYSGGSVCDADAAAIILQILKAIDFLHDREVVHRDLKPDNILMTAPIRGARIVLTDFGNARYIPETRRKGLRNCNHRMHSVVGTFEYAAPEIHRKNRMIPQDEGYSKAVDMWSIGSITAALLTGDILFTDRNNPFYSEFPGKIIMNLASECDLGVLDTSPSWAHVGSRPKDFVKNLLVLDESKRITAKEALKHSWFTNKHCKKWIEAIYERAIENWQPRARKFRYAEYIDPFGEAGDRRGSHQQFPYRTAFSNATYPATSAGIAFRSNRERLPARCPWKDEEKTPRSSMQANQLSSSSQFDVSTDQEIRSESASFASNLAGNSVLPLSYSRKSGSPEVDGSGSFAVFKWPSQACTISRASLSDRTIPETPQSDTKKPCPATREHHKRDHPYGGPFEQFCEASMRMKRSAEGLGREPSKLMRHN